MDSEILVTMPTKRFRSTKADMEVFRCNLHRIVEGMWPMTVRQCFYQAVVRGLADKTEEEVIRVGNALVLMRKANYNAEALRRIGDVPPMPLDWIVDLACCLYARRCRGGNPRYRRNLPQKAMERC
jgi:hypothetical protein